MPTTRTKRVTCTGKKMHSTAAKAQAARTWHVANGAPPASLQIYRCRHCGGYHMGHAAGSSGARRR
jgi:hypothetical protein